MPTRSSLFPIISALALAGCSVSGSGHMRGSASYVRAHRGEGMTRAVAGSEEELAAGIEKILGPTGVYTITREPGAVFARANKVDMTYAFYFSPSQEPGMTDVEVIIASPWLKPDQLRNFQEQAFTTILPGAAAQAADLCAQAVRGRGTKRPIRGSHADVYAGTLDVLRSNRGMTVAERDGAIFATFKQGGGFCHASYFEPMEGDRSVMTEFVMVSPGLEESLRKGKEEEGFKNVADRVELIELRRRQGGTAAAAPSAPPPAAVPAPSAPRLPASPRPGRARPARPDDFALVVGIEKYQSLPPADFGERDASAVREHLKALGVPEENVITLTGARATRTGLAKYLEEWLPRNVTESSRVYFFYSGHGAPDPKTGDAYLVPWDGDPMFLQSSAYPVSKVYESLERLKAREIVVALDACFSGAGGRSVLAKGTRPLVAKVETALAPDSRLSVLAASSGDEITGSLDEQGHGMFTYYLLKGLGGEADGDADGRVGLGELHGFIKTQVQRAARRQNREQTPQLRAADAGLKL